MARVPINDDLQIDDNRDFERWDWRAQRIGWIAMALVLAGAFAGVFGRGPLAHTSAAIANGGRLEYERVARHQSPAELILELPPSTIDSAIVDVSRAFMQGVDLRYIEPAPERIETTGDTMRLIVARGPGADATVRISYDPSDYWSRRGWIRVDGGAPTRFTQFVLP